MGNPIAKSEVLTCSMQTQNGQSSKINDDRLSQMIFSENVSLVRAEKAESELSLLRADYSGRIAGMVKAIAAVERSNDKANEAVAYLEKLNDLNAAGLIEAYQRTSARFRSAFPTTFGLGPLHSYKAKGVKNPGDYK